MKINFRLGRVFMPYCLCRLQDKRIVILNRDYKPLGIFADVGWVDYAAFASSLEYTDVFLKSISVHGATWVRGGYDPSVEFVWLYDDGGDPFLPSSDTKLTPEYRAGQRAALKRINLLMRHLSDCEKSTQTLQSPILEGQYGH